MAVDFTKYSNYNSQAGFSSVVFASGADLLEVELNEAQQIQNEKSRRIIRSLFGDGVLSADAITYSGGNLRLNDTYAYVDGYIIKITPTGLAYPVVTGTIKLAVWETEVQGLNDTSPSTLKLEANDQESSTVSNQITDTRLGTDFTSRRRVLKYTLLLSSETITGASYLTIGTVTAGVITSKCAQINHSFNGSAKNIGAGEDLNNYTRAGFFVVNTSTANQPSAFGGGFLLISTASTGQILQEIFNFAGTKIMTRMYYSSAWTAWRTIWTSGNMGAGSGLDADLLDGQQGSYYAPLAGPTFTGTVTLPSTTSIGTVSNTEIGYLDGVTSAIQTQINAKAPSANPTFTGTVVLPSTTSIGNVSSTEIGYLDNVTGPIQTQINAKADQVLSYVAVDASRSLILSDKDNVLRCNSSSEIIFTVPTTASVNFPGGTVITFIRIGSGVVTFVGGTGVTIYSRDGKLKIDKQYDWAAITKSDSGDYWYLTGALNY